MEYLTFRVAEKSVGTVLNNLDQFFHDTRVKHLVDDRMRVICVYPLVMWGEFGRTQGNEYVQQVRVVLECQFDRLVEEDVRVYLDSQSNV